MNRKKLDAVGAAQWIKSGKILAHPTESIWGLGCDAFIEESVNKIFYLKKRDNKKNFILLADSVDSVEKKLCYLSENDKNYLLDYWPGPYTFLINFLSSIFVIAILIEFNIEIPISLFSPVIGTNNPILIFSWAFTAWKNRKWKLKKIK